MNTSVSALQAVGWALAHAEASTHADVFDFEMRNTRYEIRPLGHSRYPEHNS